MFEKTFKAQLTLLTDDSDLIETYWRELVMHYSKPARHYHNTYHLDNILAELLPLKNTITDWQIIVFSLAYHDIIYNTLQSNNEEKSAAFARKRLSALPIPTHQIDKCSNQILATKGHNTSIDEDTNIFTDADLSILGADEEKYKRYTGLIRKVYKIYPDFIYNPGRLKVLEHFLQMKNIYKTEHFSKKYEKQARINIEGEMRRL